MANNFSMFNQKFSLLASTAIDSDLTPDANGTRSIGTATKQFKTVQTQLLEGDVTGFLFLLSLLY